MLLLCIAPLTGCHIYLYQDVRNETPQPCRISASGITCTLEPGETMPWPSGLSDDKPVRITQEGGGQLDVPDIWTFGQMAVCEGGRLWSTLLLIRYISRTLVLQQDADGQLTWKKND